MLPRRTLLQGLGAAALTTRLSRSAFAGGAPKNVLLISIDDLNDWCGVLGGHAQAKTPNIDRLSAAGTLFTNAHCSAPACNPSRTSVLLGVHPTTSGIYTNHQPFRLTLPRAETLPQFFRAHGYRTLSAGKVFHTPDRESFDEVWPARGCSHEKAHRRASPGKGSAGGIPGVRWGAQRSTREKSTSDGHIARQVVRWLHESRDEPTFIACGFHRPHLPWFAPPQYFEQYPLDSIVLPPHLPEDLDDIPEAGRRLIRLGDHNKIVASEQWPAAIQAYLASLTFADAMLGQVLDALESSPQREDTVVLLWSDHGYSLGSKMHWKKFALWEECTRVPLVISGPTVSAGVRIPQAVSLLDIWPTLAGLCGLPVSEHLEGESLLPFLADPDHERDRPAVTTWDVGSHAVRSEQHRYIRYADGSEELYDHHADPHEWWNLIGQPGSREICDQLAVWLPEEEAAPGVVDEHDCG